MHPCSLGAGVASRRGGAKITAWQSGVYEARSANAELLAFTLDKSSGGFSPTTRYRDYAISRNLIHWESQSSTRGTDRPVCATGTTSATGAASCCSLGSTPATAPSGSLALPHIAVTPANGRWRSRGNWITRCRATSTSPSPPRWPDRGGAPDHGGRISALLTNAAYINGSWAAQFSGEEGDRPVGDIDLLVLGRPDRDEVYAAASSAERRLGRAVQVTIRSADWLTEGSGTFHDTVAGRSMVRVSLAATRTDPEDRPPIGARLPRRRSALSTGPKPNRRR